MITVPSTRLTYEDYLQLPDDGNRYEVIDGELVANPAPVPRHQQIVTNLVGLLWSYFRKHAAGRVWASPIDVVLKDENVVQPDVIVVTTATSAIIEAKRIHGAPDIVIEVLSDATRRRDEIDKRKLYDRGGVPEYWIVDPELELVKIYRRPTQAFERVAEISTETGGTITTPILPGFSVDVRDVFA